MPSDGSASKERSLANLKPWKAGQTGNPNGRPPALVDIAALCRVHGPRGVEVAAALMEDPDPKVRLAAVVALWDRGYGKPKQEIASEDVESFTFQHLVAARAFTEQLYGKLTIDAEATNVDTDTNVSTPRDLMEPAVE